MSRARSGDAAGWRGRKMGGLRSSRPPRISAPERSTPTPTPSPWPVASPILPCPVPSQGQIARRLVSRRPHSHRHRRARPRAACLRSSPPRFDWQARCAVRRPTAGGRLGGVAVGRSSRWLVSVASSGVAAWAESWCAGPGRYNQDKFAVHAPGLDFYIWV